MNLKVNILIYAAVMIAWLVYALQGKKGIEGWPGVFSEFNLRMIVLILGGIIFTLIWGGIFWW